MTPLASSAGPGLAGALALAYLAFGAASAWSLLRRGHPPAAAVASLVAWPLVWSAEAPARALTPLGQRIERAAEALSLAIQSGDALDEVHLADVREISRAARAAEGRVRSLDALLADEEVRASPALADTRRRLEGARGHALAELETVLAELTALRVQVGLMSLGEGPAAAERLQALRRRLEALDEVRGALGEVPT